MNPDENLFYAFLFTLLAGLSIGLGAMVAFSKYAKNESFLAFGMGLAAGAMIFISFFELIFGALEFLTMEEEISGAFTKVTLIFLGGFIFLAILDSFVKWVAKKFGYEISEVFVLLLIPALRTNQKSFIAQVSSLLWSWPFIICQKVWLLSSLHFRM